MADLCGGALLALQTLRLEPTFGVPSWMLHLMEHAHLERLAGVAAGDYRRDPARVYLAAQKAIGTCLIDQYIPDNPLTMGATGFEGASKGATTGAQAIYCDGLHIDSPESVVDHMERFAFPRLRAAIAAFDDRKRTQDILAREAAIQATLGCDILKTGYECVQIPSLDYGTYGYSAYFAAYACYPEVIEQHFSLQADLATMNNCAAASAYKEGALPPLCRLDHDMADSRGTLVRLASLDRIWFPHLARCLEPLLRAGVRLIWHCDGNLMQMVPRLLELGIAGFQGFQYEDGMDYPAICALHTRSGEPLVIIAGASVTRTLPFGGPGDVKRELDWLVANGPPRGLFLAASSSVVPGVPWENIRTLVDGLRYYRAYRRA